MIDTKYERSAALIAAVFLVLSACNRTQNPSTAQTQAADPASGNLAPADQVPQQYQQVAAPSAPPSYSSNGTYDTAYDQPVYATEPPPPLPSYSQPPCPGNDYMWTPGYWDYSDSGYYWVPGVWVMAPYVGALWTPPYWGFDNGRYVRHTGYWGPHLGFYGGVNYGYGYTGRGYYGAYWNNGAVYYNRSVTNVNVTNIRNVYNFSPPVTNSTRVSYNGGRGGINVRPIPAEIAAQRDPRVAPAPAQIQHARQAAENRSQFASVNHDRPQTLAATAPLATSYRSPAPRPPAQAVRQAEPAQTPPARAATPNNRSPEAQERGREGPVPAPRAAAPEARNAPQQVQQPENRPPAPRAAAPEARNAPQQAQRAENRPPAPRAAAPEVRNAPQQVQQPENRPPAPRAAAPEARNAPQQVQRPENRPPAPRAAAPEARNAPQQIQRPENRPPAPRAAAPEAKAAPEQRQQNASHTNAHPPTPARRPEEKQPDEHKQ